MERVRVSIIKILKIKNPVQYSLRASQIGNTKGAN